jgi:HEAT repeat protein/outer membrane protein assembly factor BamB
MRLFTPGIVAMVLLLAPGRALPATDLSTVSEDEQLLKTAKLGTDGPALLDFFRTRARPALDPDKVAELVGQLGNDSDKISSKATAKLISLGTVAVPWLRRALKDPDDKLAATRAQFCLDSIEGNGGSAIPVAATRLLALRRPAGAAKVLLDYLPFAEDESVVDEVRETLTAIALVDGKLDKALVEALQDKLPIRRATAAEALCRAGAREQFVLVRYLLKDAKPTVRLRAALCLAEAKDQDAIPVLIDLLGKLPPAQAGLAEKVLVAVAGTQAPSVALGTDEATRKRCRDTWNTWWTSIKNDYLVEYFRKRTLADADRAKFQAMIALLGSDSYKVREKAVANLVAYRTAGVYLLMQATKHVDPEIARNAERCLKLINAAPGAALSATNARVMGLRKAERAVDVLLAYLPFADDETVGEEVRNSLAAMAFQDGKPHKALIAALGDKAPARRAVAAEALLQAGITGQQTALTNLLKDPEVPVRMRVALALAEAREKQAVPVLIDLLAQAPAEDAWRVEEALRRIGDDKAPTLALGENAASRKKCREAWAAWWKNHGDRIDLAGLRNSVRLLGYTLIAQYDNRRGSGTVYEIDKAGKVRWRIESVNYSFDLQVLRGERLLIPEYSGSRVTERDFKGKIIWEMAVTNPINAQRLPNGHTFIATRNQLLEVDRNKKEVFTINRQNYDIMAAQKLPNGQIVMLTSGGMCLRMDTKGKELKSFSVGNINYYGCLDVLPNGRMLVAQYNNNKVVEYDAKGKSVWEATVQWPTAVSRLPNGRTLVVCGDNQLILELDRRGKKVWEYKTEGRPWRARRR